MGSKNVGFHPSRAIFRVASANSTNKEQPDSYIPDDGLHPSTRSLAGTPAGTVLHADTESRPRADETNSIAKPSQFRCSLGWRFSIFSNESVPAGDYWIAAPSIEDWPIDFLGILLTDFERTIGLSTNCSRKKGRGILFFRSLRRVPSTTSANV